MTLESLVLDFALSPFVGISITLIGGINAVMEVCVRG